MSDASFEGYHCHGPMRALFLRDLAGDVLGADTCVAWLCACGVWRHATSPHRDAALRSAVEERMALRLNDLRHGMPRHEQRSFVRTERTR